MLAVRPDHIMQSGGQVYPAILNTCKQILEEARPVLYSNLRLQVQLDSVECACPMSRYARSGCRTPTAELPDLPNSQHFTGSLSLVARKCITSLGVAVSCYDEGFAADDEKPYLVFAKVKMLRNLVHKHYPSITKITIDVLSRCTADERFDEVKISDYVVRDLAMLLPDVESRNGAITLDVHVEGNWDTDEAVGRMPPEAVDEHDQEYILELQQAFAELRKDKVDDPMDVLLMDTAPLRRLWATAYSHNTEILYDEYDDWTWGWVFKDWLEDWAPPQNWYIGWPRPFTGSIEAIFGPQAVIDYDNWVAAQSQLPPATEMHLPQTTTWVSSCADWADDIRW